MRLATRVQLAAGSGVGAVGPPPFDIADLAWAGLWGASFSGSPWLAMASAGSSGSNGNLTEGTNPPATSAALNGLTGADFDGTNDVLGNAHAITTFIGASEWMVAVLFNADAAAADGAIYANPGIIVDGAGASFFFTFADAGVRVGHYDGVAYRSAVQACATGGPHLAIAWFDGVNIYVSVDGSTPSGGAIQAAGNAVLSGSLPTLGVGYTGAFFNGKVYLVAMANTDLGGTARTNIKSYVNATYALAL